MRFLSNPLFAKIKNLYHFTKWDKYEQNKS